MGEVKYVIDIFAYSAECVRSVSAKEEMWDFSDLSSISVGCCAQTECRCDQHNVSKN